MAIGLDKVSGHLPISPTQRGADQIQGAVDPGFKDILKTKTQPTENSLGVPTGTPATSPLKFSNHALDRMRSRSIGINPEDLQRIGKAVDQAAAKGAKETLVLIGNNAMIVNVKNRTVVTAMDQSLLKENVFTNIDSTVVL